MSCTERFWCGGKIPSGLWSSSPIAERAVLQRLRLTENRSNMTIINYKLQGLSLVQIYKGEGGPRVAKL